MTEQTNQPQKTQGKTTNNNINKDNTQTHNTEILRLKAGYNQHTSPQRIPFAYLS
jgi:hypothetical protein